MAPYNGPQWGGSAGWWSQSLGFFLHAPNLFVWLQEASKHICVHSKLHISLPFKVICPCRSHLIFVKIYLTGSLCFYGFHVKISQNVHQIGFIPYSTTLSIKKKTAPPPKKKNNKLRQSKIVGVLYRVGLTAVKDLIFFNLP